MQLEREVFQVKKNVYMKEKIIYKKIDMRTNYLQKFEKNTKKINLGQNYLQLS